MAAHVTFLGTALRSPGRWHVEEAVMRRLPSKCTMWLLAVTLISPSVPAMGRTDEDRRTDIMEDAAIHVVEDMKRYAAMGDHRTGSEVDLETSAWLVRSLQEAGFEDARLEPWLFRRFVLEASSLEVEGQRVESFPFWFPRSTGDTPLIGRLAQLSENSGQGSLDGAIALAELPEGRFHASFDVSNLIDTARTASAVALVVPLPHPGGKVAAQNAVEAFAERELGLPAVIVGEADRSFLRTAAERGATCSLAVTGRVVENVKALNITGRIERPGRPWVVVTTPTSGWFRCADERGPGIALWLALARWAAQTDLPASFLFKAVSGHELASLGGRQAFEGGLPDPANVVLWVHLGSTIGAADPPFAMMTGPLAMRADLADRFPGPMAMTYMPPDRIPKGLEMGMAIAAGYPIVAFFGANQRFHLQSDRVPTAPAERLHSIARAVADLISDHAHEAVDGDSNAAESPVRSSLPGAGIWNTAWKEP